MNKIYLLMEAMGYYEDYRNYPIEAFTSKELAEKVSNSLNDIIPNLVDSYKSKNNEFENRIDAIWDNENLNEEEQKRLHSELLEESNTYWKSIGLDTDVFWHGTPTYSVIEIDLIN